jgi:high-affinity iron transporter
VRRIAAALPTSALPTSALRTSALAAVALLAIVIAVAVSSRARASTPDRSAQGALAVLTLIPARFDAADLTHDAATAGRLRTLSVIVSSATTADASLRPATAAARRLQHTFVRTRVRLQPWPLPLRVRAESAAATHALQRAGAIPPATARPYGLIRTLLSSASSALGRHRGPEARLDAAGAYALFALGPEPRLQHVNGSLARQTDAALWSAVTATGGDGSFGHARNVAESDLQTAATALGDVTVSRETVVANAAVIVFREGLEAVLILAAITASFTGARRAFRRPVLIGALLGLLATAVTYVLAQTIIDALGDGGLRLQAITGVLAIAVLLVVTNWFFHKVYWSEWIGRFNRRRKVLERVDRFGFISGQTVGFVLLGITGVYREGFETVLFLQNLQISAGTGATILGVGFGLAATAIVGVTTFALERKLPYKKMLIATGVLIGIVLAVMTGVTVQNLQGLGWIPTTPIGIDIPLTWGRWLGLYPNWEGVGAQLGALVVVYGSYALARGIQLRRRRRAIRRTGAQEAAEAEPNSPTLVGPA